MLVTLKGEIWKKESLQKKKIRKKHFERENARKLFNKFNKTNYGNLKRRQKILTKLIGKIASTAPKLCHLSIVIMAIISH